MKYFISIFALFLCICIDASARSEYFFSCDAYKGEGECLFKNTSGKIYLGREDDIGRYLILVEAFNPGKKSGVLPFGFWTDTDTTYDLEYHSVHEYDDSMREVYFITDANEELMVAVKYESDSPSKIIMCYRCATCETRYIHIPYTSANYSGIYSILKEATRKIRFRR